MLKNLFTKLGLSGVLAMTLLTFAAAPEASAQFRMPDLGRIGDAVNVQVHARALRIRQ